VTRSIRLRPWQKRALEALDAGDAADFLAVATPGAGKTTFALTAAVQDLARNPHRRLVVVAPTQHLKLQWALAAAGIGLHLDAGWTAAEGRLPADMHGVVVTYQQVAANPAAIRAVAAGAFVVLDEVHHAGDDRAWGDAIRTAFSGSARRLCLSGTPFRSDTNPIPFVRYVDGQARADFEYGYGDALADGGVVRPVHFPRVNGHMEWIDSDGLHRSHRFDEALERVAAGQRLRTALSLEGEWLPAVLAQAHERLMLVRQSQPDAGGLVIAMDQDHARGIADLLRRRHGVHATVATSDDPTASDRIARYATSDAPWLVAVRMVSEGVDIPRLRVGVYATNTTTELFFRQAVGRLLRWTRGVRSQRAWLFVPDDARLRDASDRIAEVRRHHLRARPDREDDDRPDTVATEDEGEREQLSLFAAISAVALDEPVGRDADTADDEVDPGDDEVDDDSLVVALAPPPLAGVGPDGPFGAAPGGTTMVVTRRQHKKALRDANAERARALARVTGMTHAQVNAELNRLAGVGRVTEATLPQLERRLAQADRWLARL
jgi:superfamily II DNA or RNA helicase